jgi:hypothetical protein
VASVKKFIFAKKDETAVGEKSTIIGEKLVQRGVIIAL